MTSHTLEEVQSFAFQFYSLRAIATPLPGEIDFNFLMKTPDGLMFTLKIAHAAERRECLDCQNQMLLHLAKHATGLPLPKVMPNNEGGFITVIKDNAGKERYVRLLTWTPGRVFANVNPRSAELLESLGNVIGQLCNGLKGFGHPAAQRFIKWDISQAGWVNDKLHFIVGDEQQQIASHFYALFERKVLPKIGQLRQSVIYNDANDYNVLVNEDLENPKVIGVIDFGDFVHSHVINDVAIAIAYAVMDLPDPLSAAASIVRGVHTVFELHENELEVLYYLVATRLLISVVCSAINLQEHPENTYLLISERPAWGLLQKWKDIPPAFAHYAFRQACGLEPVANRQLIMDTVQGTAIFPVECKPNTKPCKLDLSVGSLDLGNYENYTNLAKFENTIHRLLDSHSTETGVGGYGEVRPFYTTDAYQLDGNDGPEWRTVHIGLDIWTKAGTPVLAPLNGRVYCFQNNTGERNYGPTIFLEHEINKDGEPFIFYTLYGHLSISSFNGLKVGQFFKKGEEFATIGPAPENGNWPPHLHFQVILDLLDKKGDFSGVALHSQQEVWMSICPDPAMLFGNMFPELKKSFHISLEKILSARQRNLGKNLSISYRKPLKMVRGMGQYLLDDSGRRYLDTVNNVAHVGHEHPKVVRVACRQNAVLNTNTRYLHENIVLFAEALLATCPAPLEVVYVVNSGSEANELALRLAKNYTNRVGIITVESGYHGNTGACVAISSYKFDGPGGKGAPPHVQVVPMPDTYRGLFRDSTDAGKKYAEFVKEALDKTNVPIAAFICESILSCGGQIVLPENYLKNVYRHVRSAGGICIADEVQTGCGRVGSHFWAFELQDVVPDILTIGKPIGNGHPLAAVVTTRAIADAFDNGMEYFNTFGGNPVSCAVGLEVLRIIEREQLQNHALQTGSYLLKGLQKLAKRHAIIGDVRGHGLFLGYELVKNKKTLEPAHSEASYLTNRLRQLGILASTDGPLHNVIKIKPPMVFGNNNADFLLEMIERVLEEDFMKVD